MERKATAQLSENFMLESVLSSAEKVASNHDLLFEILLHLPTKSLLRFKSVSKHWLSLISDPRFLHLWRPGSTPSGLFLHWFSTSHDPLPHLDFIPLNSQENYSALSFFPHLSGITFMNSCNGLVCCAVHIKKQPRPRVTFHDDADAMVLDSVRSACSKNLRSVSFHVINPSTRQFTNLCQPHLSHLEFEGLGLAFDPSKSCHYKLVCVWSNTVCLTSEPPYRYETYYQIEIYSSETESWKASNETFTAERYPGFHRGVYWNGAINWFNSSAKALYFHVEEERLGSVPELTFQQGFWFDRAFCLGESGGHLYLVEKYNPTTELKVYEMVKDYSGWVMKYAVDLCEVGKAFPQMMEGLAGRILPCAFYVLSLVWREEDNEDPFVVVTLPGKIIRFNIEDQSFREMCDVDPVNCDEEGMVHDSLRYFSSRCLPYIECLFSTSP